MVNDQVEIRRSARRRRSVALRVQRDGSVVVMAPERMTDPQISDYLQRKSRWISDKRAELELSQSRGNDFRDDGVVSYLGQRYPIRCAIATQVDCRLIDGTLRLGLPAKTLTIPDKIAHYARCWCRDQAERLLPSMVAALAVQLGAKITAVQIKNYRARWGSCTQKAVIQLNWKLIFCPPDVICYVIIHELRHLTEFNHSKAFWTAVERAMPDYKVHRKWLKENGSAFIAD